ncbi:exodeoxyribonuclease VII small subunit [Candidatus Saccharibacteria bacterium]|nr:exodeoxyribonuclease VII small subunit [Candidatus Saccharibacteria bacterium]
MSTKNKPLQDKIDELNRLVEWFNQEDFSIEDALEKFKKADALAAEIEQQLDGLKNKVIVLKERFDKE